MKLTAYNFDRILVNAELSYKLDGVQAVRSNGTWRSRADKPLYNLPDMPDGIYEVFLGSWEDTISAVRTHVGAMINMDNLYRLYPKIDKRLRLRVLSERLSPNDIKAYLAYALQRGYEGVCIKCDQGHFKVKPKHTYDVKVTGIQEGTGRNKGVLGALITKKGKVGVGFTDKNRKEYYTQNMIGQLIEVESMGLTPNDKFRHPRFMRLREDKLQED